jgi:hypothetical protein
MAFFDTEFFEVSGINAVLDRAGVSLGMLFDEDDLLQECYSGNEKLLTLYVSCFV